MGRKRPAISMRRSSRWRSRSGSRPCWSSGITRYRGAPTNTARSRPICSPGAASRSQFLGADGPTSQQAPVYPIVVAAAYAIGGVGTPRALLLLELGQSVLGGLLVWGVLRLARLVVPAMPDHGADGRIGRGPPPDARLCRDARPGRRTGCDPAGLDARLGLPDRGDRTGHATPRSPAWLLAVLALTDPILSLAMIGIARGHLAWAERRAGAGLRRSFRLSSWTIARSAWRGSRRGWCATPWSTANSSRSRARSAMPSGRATAR